MPEKSRRVLATHVARVSKKVDAPLDYVYDWCTDFRTDDGKLSGSKPKYKVIRIGKRRIVRIRVVGRSAGKEEVAIELIRLSPPNRWHVDQIDERDLEAVDYSLKRLGPRKTLVTLDITERWMSSGFPSRAEWVRGTNLYWDHLMSALLDRYQKGLPALG